MRILLWISLLLNLLLVGGVGYIFMKGTASPAEEGREAIALLDAEKSYMLEEMRGMLETMQGVVLALEANDMKDLAGTARKGGMATMKNTPKSLMLKLPMSFKSLGRSMHAGWDQIADEAQGMGRKDRIISILGEQLGRCTACHSAFRLE